MTNQIEPYSMIQKTNIKEHNDMVNKINEIVDVINNVNLDTINAEISGLKAKATATDTEIANIKNKDSMQDTEIAGIDKSLISDVTATFDNPSRELKISVGKKDSTSIDATVVIPSSSETGQYSAGNGITIQDYQIAVDTNVVALKTDIPVVPDVSGINNRLDTIDGEITGINANITNLTNKNTEQDTAINGKVAIAQDTENAGKVLGIGADGNVTPVNAGGSSGGGSDWVLRSEPITNFIKWESGSSYNTYTVTDDLIIRVVCTQNGVFCSINDIFVKKCSIRILPNAGINTSYYSAVDFSASSRIAITASSPRSAIKLEVGGYTANQATTEETTVGDNEAKYWIYTKGSS